MYFKRINSPIILKMTVGLSALHRNILIGRHDIFKEGCFTKEDGSLRISSSLPLLCSRYHVLSMIGEGTFSQILLCEDTFSSTNNHVILKVLKIQYDYIGHQEIRVLNILHSADPESSVHIVHLKSSPFQFHSHICLPLSIHGCPINIQDRNNNNNLNHISNVRNISLQLLTCFCFLKNNGILHTDLKPDNVLLTHHKSNGSLKTININSGINKYQKYNNLVKPSVQSYSKKLKNLSISDFWSPSVSLIDFGNAIEMSDIDRYILSGVEIQSLPYRAPEVLLHLPFGFPAEIWSLGCLMIEMLSGDTLFHASSPQELYNEMVDYFGPFPLSMTCKSSVFPRLHSGYLSNIPDLNIKDSFTELKKSRKLNSIDIENRNTLRMKLIKITGSADPQLISLLIDLLDYNPDKRITAHQSILHPFFNSIIPFSFIYKLNENNNNNNNNSQNESGEKKLKKFKSLIK